MARPIWLTIAQAARIYRVSPHTIRSWARRGHVTMNRVGRVDASTVETYLDGRGTWGQHRSRRGPAN